MGYERKRNPNLENLSEAALAGSSSSAHAFSRPPHFSGHVAPRSPSPPASAYFPLLSADHNSDAQLRPTRDAEQHFAYSTTLRRHNVEPASLASPAEFAHEASNLWGKALAAIAGQPSPGAHLEDGRVTPHVVPKEDRRDTVSARFAHCSVEDTIAHFRTSATEGLLKSEIPNLLQTHGYNEFSVSTPEPLLLKFAKTIYESPLILLLCASATVSAIMGNIDDAISITVAVLIVLTGMLYLISSLLLLLIVLQLALFKKPVPKKVSKL